MWNSSWACLPPTLQVHKHNGLSEFVQVHAAVEAYGAVRMALGRGFPSGFAGHIWGLPACQVCGPGMEGGRGRMRGACTLTFLFLYCHSSTLIQTCIASHICTYVLTPNGIYCFRLTRSSTCIPPHPLLSQAITSVEHAAGSNQAKMQTGASGMLCAVLRVRRGISAGA